MLFKYKNFKDPMLQLVPWLEAQESQGLSLRSVEDFHFIFSEERKSPPSTYRYALRYLAGYEDEAAQYYLQFLRKKGVEIFFYPLESGFHLFSFWGSRMRRLNKQAFELSDKTNWSRCLFLLRIPKQLDSIEHEAYDAVEQKRVYFRNKLRQSMFSVLIYVAVLVLLAGKVWVSQGDVLGIVLLLLSGFFWLRALGQWIYWFARKKYYT